MQQPTAVQLTSLRKAISELSDEIHLVHQLPSISAGALTFAGSEDGQWYFSIGNSTSRYSIWEPLALRLAHPFTVQGWRLPRREGRRALVSPLLRYFARTSFQIHRKLEYRNWFIGLDEQELGALESLALLCASELCSCEEPDRTRLASTAGHERGLYAAVATGLKHAIQLHRLHSRKMTDANNLNDFLQKALGGQFYSTNKSPQYSRDLAHGLVAAHAEYEGSKPTLRSVPLCVCCNCETGKNRMVRTDNLCPNSVSHAKALIDSKSRYAWLSTQTEVETTLVECLNCNGLFLSLLGPNDQDWKSQQCAICAAIPRKKKNRGTRWTALSGRDLRLAEQVVPDAMSRRQELDPELLDTIREFLNAQGEDTLDANFKTFVDEMCAAYNAGSLDDEERTSVMIRLRALLRQQNIQPDSVNG